MNTRIDLVEHHRLHDLAVVRAQQLRREAVAELGNGIARRLMRLVRNLRHARQPGLSVRRSRTLEA